MSLQQTGQQPGEVSGELSGELPEVSRPSVFGPPGRELLGFYHAPLASPSGRVVVLCNPLGYEALSVHRAYRHLAERLAARGLAAFRFDYPGTGDSSGEPAEPHRVRAWVSGIKEAIREAQARSFATEVALVGVRFGATLAAIAAEEHAGIEALVAWAPIVTGRTHVRELRAFRMMRDPKAARPPDGSEEIGGFVFTRDALAEMSATDLLAVGRVANRALVLPGERPGDETKLVQHLTTKGVAARLIPATGYGRMMRDDPYETEVPFAALDAIVEWLGEGSHPTSPAAANADVGRPAVLNASAPDGTALRETPLRFGPDDRLFGILTDPQGTPRPDRPAVCLLNVGGNSHVGPHRMNVDLARDLASRGYVVFRMDAAGLGESRVAKGTRENRIYTMDAVADVTAAMALLGRLRARDRFVLVGLCSGAYLAYHTAVRDRRVLGQLLLSPYAFEWKEGDPVAPTVRQTFEAYRSTRSYARAILDPLVWRRLLRGEVNVRGIFGVLIQRVSSQLDEALPTLGARIRGRRRPENDVERDFRALCERGVVSWLVSSFDDGGLDMVARYLGSDARKMRGRANFSLRVLEGIDHTFTSVASQKRLLEILHTYMDQHFP